METFLPDPDILLDPPELPEIPLPKGWSEHTLLAVLHVVALARIIVMNVANWPSDRECDGLRLRVENDRLKSEINLLQQEISIKDARFARIDPKKRPTYNASERFEILALKAIRGWSNEQIAKRFQISERSIRRWFHGSETQSGLTQLPEAVTRYPDFVRMVVRRLKSFCPMLGRNKISEILCRTGLHLSASTVKRIIDEPPKESDSIAIPPDLVAPRIVTSKYLNHVWGGDITLVPTAQGLALGVEPEAMPQEHPYCFHVLNVMDHFSRRLMGSIAFMKNPTAADIVSAMQNICDENGASPKHIIFDHGTQFYCTETLEWCKNRNIKPRFGAIGKHGSIAVVERLHLSMKNECTRRIVVPIGKDDFTKEIDLWREWYNFYRPHMTLGGKTPDEVFFGKRAANILPRIETRPKVHHSTPCAKPRTMMAGKAGRKVETQIAFLEGRLHLPILLVQRE